MDMNREEARQIVAEISSYNVWTTFIVEENTLKLGCLHGSLTNGQHKLARAHWQEIVEYLKTPPEQTGVCYRCESKVLWKCNQYGVWVCYCYFWNKKSVDNWREIKNWGTKPKKQKKAGIADYWTRSK